MNNSLDAVQALVHFGDHAQVPQLQELLHSHHTKSHEQCGAESRGPETTLTVRNVFKNGDIALTSSVPNAPDK